MLNLTAYNGVPVVDVKCADTSLCHTVNCFRGAMKPPASNYE